jgi:hypothetical protein
VVRGREAQGKEGVEGNIPVNAPTITLVTYLSYCDEAEA